MRNLSKKHEIISAAREIIYSKGYQATSINDILMAAEIGKGQFYHYFSSKYDLGLAVVESIVHEWQTELISDILQSDNTPVNKLNMMLARTLTFHTEVKNKSGCPIGNLAIEMSEHDETFRVKIQHLFECWIGAIEITLNEMVEQGLLDSFDTKKDAQAIVAMIEGGILLMKNQQNVNFLSDIIEVIRKQFNLE